jgi:hypothetical protein
MLTGYGASRAVNGSQRPDAELADTARRALLSYASRGTAGIRQNRAAANQPRRLPGDPARLFLRPQVRTASAALCRDGQLDRIRSGVYQWPAGRSALRALRRRQAKRSSS